MKDYVEHWSVSAACAQVDPDLWFPIQGGNPRHAKRICERCEVKTECLAAAGVDDGGIWGALSDRERRGATRGRIGKRRSPRKATA